MSELRVNNFPDEILAVMDGYGQATGKCRTDITIEVLGRWAEQKKHEATLICRVAGVNPHAKESVRINSSDSQ
jgi:hypothetical protein